MTKAKKTPAKRTAKGGAKKASAKPNGVGVIATIKSHLESKPGATKAEILDGLVKQFPDRSRDGMASTVQIQCSRLARTTGRAIIAKDVVDRGRVYKFEDQGPIPGKEVVKEAAAEV